MNVRTRIRAGGITAMALAGLLAAGCDESLRDITGPSPDLVPTFESINSEIFQDTDLAGRAACAGCHTGLIPNITLRFAGGADVYSQLVNVPSRQRPAMMLVAPGDPENSYLIHKLEGRSGIAGQRMPRGSGPFLTDGQLRVIRRWIEIGAPR